MMSTSRLNGTNLAMVDPLLYRRIAHPEVFGSLLQADQFHNSPIRYDSRYSIYSNPVPQASGPPYSFCPICKSRLVGRERERQVGDAHEPPFPAPDTLH